MPAKQNVYGWCVETAKWVHLRVDADGSIHIVGYVDELDDIGDVNVPTPGDGEVLYWKDDPGEWRTKAIPAAAWAEITGKPTAPSLEELATEHEDDGTHGEITPATCTLKPGDGDLAPKAHKDSHDPQDGADKLDTAIAVKVGDANAVGVSHSLARADHVHEKHHAKYTDGEAGTAGVAAVEAAGLVLASGKNIQLYTALANLGYSGLTAIGTAAITDADGVGKACYVNGSGKVDHADKDSAATMPCSVLQTSDTTADESAIYLLQGFIRQNTWNWTIGGILYVGDDGALTQDVSGYTTGDQVQVVGVALSADVIYFNPSYELVEIS